ncbi:MAG: tRNA uridine 5-oxyacetic acid(34) methyltransferase CmoM [Deltaproteobacteria bacterium]|nr:MAG: tRNA uridine 5-oxyacetic acid(34) methyltransferase CmoM [Deltaproteobacteria bacterium]
MPSVNTPPLQDRNFDELADKIKARIYGSFKGRLRLDLVKEDFRNHLPELNTPPLNILDAGGGFAPISIDMATAGHRITICDISAAMLERAEKRAHDAGVSGQIRLIHGPFQSLSETASSAYDLVLGHAVLEWLAAPRQGLTHLAACVKPGGALSLMIYNLHALVFRNALQGNFRKIMNAAFAGHPRSLTPTHPLEPEAVARWLDAEALRVCCQTGIRVFTDCLRPEIREARTYADILALERRYARINPFADMGRYIHFLTRKADAPVT